MKKRFVPAFIMTLVLTLFLVFNALAAGIEFAADFTMTDAKGKVVATGKFFMKNEKIRQETAAEGETNVTIVRIDKKVAWTLLSNNQYMEVAIKFDPKNPELSKEIEYDKAVIGQETVNGYDCQVVQYTYKEKKYGVAVQWIAAKLQFPVRTQTKDAKGKITATVDYANIKPGPQPDSLFEVPAGYQKMTLPFKLPGSIIIQFRSFKFTVEV